MKALACVRFAAFSAFFFVVAGGVFIQKRVEFDAAKGKFMVHMLHSAYFFPQTVEVKWSASIQGKPTLPVWLHLFPSRHRAIAYLIGTPVTPLKQVTVHVIAKRIDNYRSAEQFITIKLNDDVRFNTSTQQIVQLRIKNVEAEDFIGKRDNKIRLLEKAIRETFRGKGVNPYIFNIFSEIEQLREDFRSLSGQRKIASIIQIGTQYGFHLNVHNLVEGLNRNPEYCSKSHYIPMDRQFRDNFDVDWCKFELKNVTMIKTLEQHAQAVAAMSGRYRAEKNNVAEEVQAEKAHSRKALEDMDAVHRNYPINSQSLFETVLVFPLLAVLCIILVLILSVIFFGRREGQHWRDYKTPKERLHEYLDVRESQRHLREMSVQRQILFMSEDAEKSSSRMSINTFLRPRDASLTSSRARQSPVVTLPQATPYSQDNHLCLPTSCSASPALTHQRFARRANSTSAQDSAADPYGYRTPHSSVGKQTVAEAARATGSSLHLYRNSVNDNDMMDEHFNDSNDTKPLRCSGYGTAGVSPGYSSGTLPYYYYNNNRSNNGTPLTNRFSSRPKSGGNLYSTVR